MQSNNKQSAPKKDGVPKKDSVDRGRGGGGSTEKKNDQHQRDPIYSMPSIPKKHGNPGQVPPSVEAEKKEKGKEKEKYVSMDLSGNFGGNGQGTANGNGGTGNGGNGTGGESTNTSLNNNSKRKIGAEDEQEKPRKKIHLDESLNPLPIPKPNPIPEPNLNPNPVLNPFLHNEDYYPIPDGLSEGEVMFFYHTAMDAIYRVLDYAIVKAMNDIPPDDAFFTDLAEMAVRKPRPNDPEIPLNYRNPVVVRKVGKDPTLWEFNTKINFLKSTKYEKYFTTKCSTEFGFKKFIGLLLDLKNDRNKVVHEKEGGNFYSRKIVSIFLNLLSLQRVFGLSILSYVEKKDKTLFHHLLYKCALGRDLLEEIKEVKDENRRLMERKIVSVEDKVASVGDKVVSVEDKIAKVVKEKVAQVEDTFRNRLEANEKTMKAMEVQLTELKEEHRGQMAELQKKNEEQLVGVQNQVASLDTKITSLSTTNECLLAQLTQVISTLASNKTPKDQ